MKHYIALLALIAASIHCSGQTITDVDAFQAGNEIIVEYTIKGDMNLRQNTLYSVIPSFSIDGGKNFTALRSISGNLENIPAGKGHRIVWRVTEDYETFVHPSVIFKVDFKGSSVSDATAQSGYDHYLKGLECEKGEKYADAIRHYRMASQMGYKQADERIRALQLLFW